MKNIIVSLLIVLTSITPVFGQNNIKRVAILETVDKEGDVSYGIKLMTRSMLASAIAATKGYEAYDRVDLNQILGEHEFQRTGMVNDLQIKRLGEMTGAQYILVAEVAMIDASVMLLTAKILDVETARLEKTSICQTTLAPDDIQKSCEKLSQDLLGIKSIGIQSSKTSSTGLFSKDDLIRAGFKFFNPPKELKPIDGVNGQSVLENYSFDNHSYANSYYYEGENKYGKLCGIVFFYDAFERRYVLTYAVDGCIAYPVITAYNYQGHSCIGVDEGGVSYLRMSGNWAKPIYRPMFSELMRVYGDFIDSDAFRGKIASGDIEDYIYYLKRNFSRFVDDGNVIDSSAWDEENDI